MAKNIWYVSKYANILKYGANTRQSYFCEQFAEQGFNVRLIVSNSSHLYESLPTFSKSHFDETASGYHVTWVNSVFKGSASSFKRILSWFVFELGVILMAFRKKYEKPDVIIASSLSLLTVLSGFFYKKFFGAVFIFEVRDIWPKSIVDIKGVSNSKLLIRVLRQVEHLGYKHADHIVGTMPGLKEHVQKEVGLGSKVSFIPQGVDLSFYDNCLEPLNDSFWKQFFPSGKIVVTYTGSFGEANGLEFIVQAAKLLEAESSNIHFLMVGDGYLKEALMSKASGLSNMSFAPAVKKTQVNAILEKSDILIASVLDRPIYEYGISLNKFIDYMYAKKPIVCMFSGHPSLINESGCGFFTPSEDARVFASKILTVANLPESERVAMGMNGYRYLLENMTYPTLTKKYMELFDEASI